MSQAAIQFQTDRNAVNLKEAGLNSQTAAEEFTPPPPPPVL